MADTDLVTEAQIEALVATIAAEVVGVQAELDDLKSNVAYINFFGTDVDTARVSGYAMNLWIGEGQPVNTIPGDKVFDESETVTPA